jgi:hypothetical protein
MLIDNKFIYLSLPRCGSTSFHYSCILNNLSVKTIQNVESINSNIDFNSINEKQIMDYIEHGHEPLTNLLTTFGDNYPIIAVKRERHSVFYSLFKHIIYDLARAGKHNVAEHLMNMELDDLFFFSTQDLINKKTRWNIINDYLIEHNLINNRYNIPKHLNLYSDEYVINVIDILLTPTSYWHNNHKNIIWFDISNLTEMETWVSNIIDNPFKIKNVNSSNHIECNIKLDDNFIKKYDTVYDYFDFPKHNKTLI